MALEAMRSCDPDSLQVLTVSGLDNIKRHKYTAGAYTPVDNLINPLWVRLTTFLPRWLAPNLVTLIGTAPLVALYIMYAFTSPKLDGDAPPWLLLVGGVCVLFYQTMDAMDGKQARRTQSSSPLGQLVDHGCDCLCMLSHNVQAVAVFHGRPLFVFLLLTVTQLVFFVAQFEEYHTGVLNTSAGPVGVTEVQMLLIVTLIAVGVAEASCPGLVFKALAAKSLSGMRASEVNLVVVVILSGCLGTVPLYRGFSGAWRRSSAAAASRQLATFALQSATIFVWSSEAREHIPRLICLVHGLCSCLLTDKMILASMARQDFPMVHLPCVLAVLGVALSHVLSLAVLELVAGLIAIAVAACFIAWHVVAARQITRALVISMFTIKPPAKAAPHRVPARGETSEGARQPNGSAKEPCEDIELAGIAAVKGPEGLAETAVEEACVVACPDAPSCERGLDVQDGVSLSLPNEVAEPSSTVANE